MVAKTPLKGKMLAMALNPNLVRETVQKVDRCMARLQELQCTVAGGTKVVAGVSLSPRSTRGYLRTSLRCKQESLRLKNAGAQKSPVGKFQGNASGEWRRMSLPAMLLDETVTEIIRASRFAKEIAAAAAHRRPNSKKEVDDPKTPEAMIRRPKRPNRESTELRSRRTREKRSLRRSDRSELDSPSPLPRARSRIAFRSQHSPFASKSRPWAKKTVLFPNPNKFYKTRSPIIARAAAQQKTPPHRFLIKSPPTSLKSRMKSQKAAVPAPLVFSPVEKKLYSPKIRRCSFSPAKLANRLLSPLRGRVSLQASGGRCGLISGPRQRPNFSTPLKIPSIKRIAIFVQ